VGDGVGPFIVIQLLACGIGEVEYANKFVVVPHATHIPFPYATTGLEAPKLYNGYVFGDIPGELNTGIQLVDIGGFSEEYIIGKLLSPPTNHTPFE
jgi:hypothetical protein